MHEKTKDEIINLGVTAFDFLANVPIASTVKSIANIYSTAMQEIFFEKLEAFVLQYQNVSEHEKEAFASSYANDVNGFTKKLLIVIDRIDSKEKAEIIGKVFKAVIQQKIKMELFWETSYAVQNTYIGYLNFLISGKFKEDASRIEAKLAQKQLASTGLMYENLEQQMGAPAYNYVPSYMGDVLYNYGK